MSSNVSMDNDNKDIFFRIKCVFLIIILIGTVYVILFMSFAGFLRNWQLLEIGASAVALSPWVIPALIGSFALLVLAWALFLRLVDKDKGKFYERTIHVAIVICCIAIVIRLPMGFIIDNYLSSRNYSYCYWYTPPANFSPPVWVREPQLCIEQTGHIRKMLFKWMQAQPYGGRDLTLLDVQQKVAELNAAHAAGEFVY